MTTPQDFCVLFLLAMVQFAFGQVRILPESPSVVRKEGEDVVFTCQDASTSLANQQLRWYGPTGAEISGTDVRVFTESSQGMSRLRVLQIQRQDGGNYTCRGDSGDEMLVVLIVFKPITFDSAPPLQNFQVNSDAVLECQVSGDPHPSVVWYRDNNEVGNSAKYRKLANNNLVIANIQLQDAGMYKCEASVVSDGRFAERDIEVAVLYPPAVFMDTPDTVGAVVGFTVNISCSAGGNPTPQMSWYRDDRMLLPTADGSVMVYTAEGVSILGLKVNSSKDFGEYNCTAHNQVGSVSRTIILREAAVPTPPTELRVTHLTAHQATVTFKKSYSESGAPVTHYVTEISGSNGDMSSQVGDAAMTTMMLDGLTKNTSYSVRLRGVNIAGTSGASESLNFTTLAEEPNPDAPVILSRKMGTDAAMYELRVSVPNDLADPITECMVSYREVVTTGLMRHWNNITVPCNENTTITTIFITGLQPNTEYQGRFYARKTSGTAETTDFTFMTKEEVRAKQVGGVSAGGTAAIVIVVLLILIVAVDVTCCALGKGGATLFLWNKARGNAKSVPIKDEEAPEEQVETIVSVEEQPTAAEEPKDEPKAANGTAEDVSVVKEKKPGRLPSLAVWWGKFKRTSTPKPEGAGPTDAAENDAEKPDEDAKVGNGEVKEDSNQQKPEEEPAKPANGETVKEENAKDDRTNTEAPEVEETAPAKPDVVGGTDATESTETPPAESTETTLLLDETNEEEGQKDPPESLAV